MSDGLTIWSLALLGFCVLAEIARELNFKAASMRAEHGQYAISLLTQPLLWCGIGLWVVEVGLWLLVKPPLPVLIAALLACAFIIYRHKSNIQKLRQGTENLFQL